MPIHSPEKTSIHGELLDQISPDWLVNATPERRAALKYSNARLPDWYLRASSQQRQDLNNCFIASFSAQTLLDKTMSTLQDIDTFAAPLLTQALKDRFGVEVDVNETQVCLRRPLAVGALEIEVSDFEVMKFSLLQAALHNFEESECEENAFHRKSGFLRETETPGTFLSVTVSMTVPQFLTLCRSLDIGSQYQAYVKAFFAPADTRTEMTLREQFITSQKLALKAAAELALLKKDILHKDYEMILSVIDGEVHPWQGHKQVWFRDLDLMKRRMTGCMVFSICEKYRYTDEFIVYIPHDPQHPLKRYTPSQMRETFKRRFTARDASASGPGAVTSYQRFFSQFVAYADRPYYFSQFTRKAADAPVDPLHSVWWKVAQYIPPISTVVGIRELPPEPRGKREPVDDPYLNPGAILQAGSAGIWAANTDLWTYLYEQNRAKVIADARSHAVPTADVDAQVRARKLNHLLEIGMLGLNMVSMFVPVLGEIMMTVMAGQLLYETLEGAVEWGEGDREAAKAHLIDVAQNLALIGVMAGAGKGLAKLTAVKPEPVIDSLDPVTLPSGDTRLWKPDLSVYESNVVLDNDVVPDASGQYRLNDKTFIRQAGKVYETHFDESLKKWRIKHPADSAAYQPILAHNGHGAWRHTLERPLQWDRLTLLRRMGHVTEAFSDEQLLKIADASGIDDNALRKMHMDHLPPPPELAEALRVFSSDAESAEVAGQAPPGSLIDRLQRACPGLGESSAQRILLDADAEQLARLKTTRRIPLKMLEEARWYARQGRVSRAFADLHLRKPVSADSRRLAMRALERLAGWDDQVRLEIREGGISGPLLDAIGHENAATRKYVVKNGPAYQAFDERGETLNGVPREGDNFFSSIMHALPDQSRQSLGLSHVGQSGGLHDAVIDSAGTHRAALTQLLEQRTAKSRMFKPPVRVAERMLGYYASGRGQNLNPSLVSRVRDVYPGLTDQQANGFILEQSRAGKTDTQIYNDLQTRMREWQALESTLDQWAGEPATVLESMLGGRQSVARKLKDCWRNSPLAQEMEHLRNLDLTCDDPLPALSADFSHVRGLSLRGRFINDANIDALLGTFPNVESLRINATGSNFTQVPDALVALPHLTSLNLYSAEPFAAQMSTKLSRLTNLVELTIYSPGIEQTAFDLSGMRKLRRLGISTRGLREWPVGILELPNLESVYFKGTGISTLPRAMYEGHERLWKNLQLDWSNFSREDFKPAYEYVKSHPEHLLDVEEMVRSYAKGELLRLGEGIGQAIHAVPDKFFEHWQGAQARFDSVEALSEQSQALNRQLDEWVGQAMVTGPTDLQPIKRSMVATNIRNCWRNGAFKPYGATADASILDLPFLQLHSLPELPGDAFAHVKSLYLTGAKATAEQFQSFVHRFSELQMLDLSDNDLTQVPIVSGDLAKLTRLDLSNNRILSGAALKESLSGLSSLEYLNLRNNPIDTFDASGLQQLKALSLRGTGLLEWPAGSQDLAQLEWLDLRDSKISSLPEAALQGDVQLKTELTGAPLTAQARQALETAWQRIEDAKGLPEGALSRFTLENVQEHFPPNESAFSLAGQLLPVPEVPVGEGSAQFAVRLQQLNPELSADSATQAIERLRKDGVTDVQIGERLAGWEQTCERLTRQLNGWLFTQASRGPAWIVTTGSRKLAALRILGCWRESLGVENDVVDRVLNLNGLELGDLPELPAEFSHVDTLNLTGVRLTAQGSNDFLKAFTQVKSLQLNGNDLGEIPDQLQYMNSLERLELSANRLTDADHLYASLHRLERLKWLDLSYNGLGTFDVDVFPRLETLDLRNNGLVDWPRGVLDADNLRTLNLSGNDITYIPAQALDGSHDALMGGTDLSDNFNLTLDSLEQLRDYREAGARDEVLGFSRSELDELIDQTSYDSEGESENESVEADEDLPDEAPDSAQKAPWLTSATPEEAIARSQTWDQLAAEPDNAAFFHLLQRLQDTQEFRVANADLTRRVWTVMDAAASNTELREKLFASSSTHGTCVDGRILTFSELEGTVFVHNALLDIPAGHPAMKGQALLRLSRQLFRRDKIDELATKAAVYSGEDQAEVRLGYRIGLTSGWSDGLELPGQPKHMTYASGVTAQQLADARIEVSNAERSDQFVEDLIKRDYWVEYLKEKYPEEFSRLDDAEKPEEIDDADDAALMEKLFELAAARNGKMIELSRNEIEGI